MNRILGFHFGHDSSITLLENGVPKCCMSEEKLSRVKMYYGAPLRSLEYVMKEYNLSPKDIDKVAVDTINLPRLIVNSFEMKLRFSKIDKKKEIETNINKSKKVLNYILGSGINQDRIKDEANKSLEIFYQKMEDLGFLEKDYVY